mmetsp:Transcript_16922/g.54094  ORF Transcript_16922/g.54094 Transcript_16922/m.54094 type:complete len:358 (+) Transcript_16922:100-1173(+)
MVTVAGCNSTPLVGAGLVLGAVVDLRSLRHHLPILTLNHGDALLLHGVQPPVSPEVQQAHGLRRRRVGRLCLRLDDDLVDPEHGDVLPDPQETGLLLQPLVLEGDPLSRERLLLDGCLYLGVGHRGLAYDGEVLGPNHQHSPKDDFITRLSSSKLLCLHQVADGDLVLVYLAGLDHSEGVLQVQFRWPLRPWRFGRQLRSWRQVRHLTVPDEGARWLGGRVNASHGLPMPCDLHLARAEPRGPLPAHFEVGVRKELIHVLVHVLHGVLGYLGRHVPPARVVAEDDLQLVAEDHATRLHWVPDDGADPAQRGPCGWAWPQPVGRWRPEVAEGAWRPPPCRDGASTRGGGRCPHGGQAG